MIKINLLPHREEKRKQKKSAFIALMALSAVLGVLVVIAVGGYNARRISIQEERNGAFVAAILELDKKIAEIANLKQEIEALKARQQAVEDLQGERNQPVYLLDELVRQTPQGVYLKTFKQEGQRVTVGGFAQSQERVAELLRNIAGNSPWLERPDLTEVRAAQLAQSKTGKKVVEFTLNLFIKRQREKNEALKPGQKPLAGATAASGSPAPATAAP
ncbi:PilN domain-containing protein [Massilia sp. CCM 8734]|uniref:PilN domain-containing protein n=1 Tax=Massilia sp. CCM 8734 TaxID=2609283 RepID=UPI00141EB29C|nr:PilN domain-containing protein [Massilia sp. CCM 8734]NIA00007.1 fimbrial assembly protein [Massilia sp. CCM 8734]